MRACRLSNKSAYLLFRAVVANTAAHSVLPIQWLMSGNSNSKMLMLMLLLLYLDCIVFHTKLGCVMSPLAGRQNRLRPHPIWHHRLQAMDLSHARSYGELGAKAWGTAGHVATDRASRAVLRNAHPCG